MPRGEALELHLSHDTLSVSRSWISLHRSSTRHRFYIHPVIDTEKRFNMKRVNLFETPSWTRRGNCTARDVAPSLAKLPNSGPMVIYNLSLPRQTRVASVFTPVYSHVQLRLSVPWFASFSPLYSFDPDIEYMYINPSDSVLPIYNMRWWLCFRFVRFYLRFVYV